MSGENKNTERQAASERPAFGPGGRGRGPGPGGPMMMMMPGAKAKNFKGSMKRLFGYLGKDSLALVIVTILAVAANVFMFLGPRILGQATDEIAGGVKSQAAGGAGIDFARIGVILLSLVVLYIVSSCFGFLQNFVMSGVTTALSYRLRKDLSEKIHRLPFGFFDRTSHGDVLSRITNDVDTLSQTLNQSLVQIAIALTSFIGVIIMMFTISWQLTLMSLCVIPVSMLLVSLIVKKSSVHFKSQQNYLGAVNGHVEEMFGSHVVVRAFNGEKNSLEQFDKGNNALYNSAWKANFLSGLIMPITGIISNMVDVAICIMGGYYAVNGAMTIGGIQAFLQYVRTFMQPITQIANMSNILQQTAAAAERVFEFMDEAEEIQDPENAPRIVSAHAAGAVAVRFDHIRFGYVPDKVVINDFSAQVKSGQKIAIVGPTGAGKTTIVKLLMRFYDVSGGAILIDGHDIREYRRTDLRSVFGMVLQDTWLFNGTIADNIRYGKLGATDEEVRRAAVTAQADHFVRTLPGDYSMLLNEEADNISQGQKQLLTIARAILADPEILILDEATSNVDTRTEILIQRAMDNLMKERTSFVIAHRLSTIRNADLILVMREGDIVEQGSHTELLSQGGFYASLYNSQFDPE
jgi:ATP-binding cassette subfamily B protein